MLDVFETISTSNTGVADTFMDSEVLNGNIKKKKREIERIMFKVVSLGKLFRLLKLETRINQRVS